MAKKITSKDVASKASAALRDGRSSKRTKSIAASALSQREKKANNKIKLCLGQKPRLFSLYYPADINLNYSLYIFHNFPFMSKQ